MLNAQTDSRCEIPGAIEQEFVDEILSPYKTNATYLKAVVLDDPSVSSSVRWVNGKSAANGILAATGEFSIPESCYIDDTGHFNAVEFNICFNQLAYVMFGELFRSGLVHQIAPEIAKKMDMNFSEYKNQQLSSMFIVKYESRFKQPIDSRSFQAQITLKRITSLADTIFAHTTIRFFDTKGGSAEGKILLAFSSQATH